MLSSYYADLITAVSHGTSDAFAVLGIVFLVGHLVVLYFILWFMEVSLKHLVIKYWDEKPWVFLVAAIAHVVLGLGLVWLWWGFNADTVQALENIFWGVEAHDVSN